jgi:hypothetical protein
MAKYIDREALLKALEDDLDKDVWARFASKDYVNGVRDEYSDVLKIIENMPYFVKGEISTTLEEKFDEYRSLLEECERKLSYLLDCEIESSFESLKVKELITKLQSVI